MEFVTVGDSIKIKRTDGRIHGAVISKLNAPAKSVTVEWYERGETKGKEIELDAIFILNPELLPNSEQEQLVGGSGYGGGSSGGSHVTSTAANTGISLASTNLTSSGVTMAHAPTAGSGGHDPRRYSTAAGSHLTRNATNGAIATGNAVGGARTNRISYNIQQGGGAGGMSGGSGVAGGGYLLGGSNSSSNVTLIPQDGSSMGNEPGHGLGTTAQGGGGSGVAGIGVSSGILRSRTTSNALRLNSAAAAAVGPTASTTTYTASNNNIHPHHHYQHHSGNTNNNNINNNNQNHVSNSVAQTTNSSSIASSNVGTRRSYVVKEVERLKENREKRRARQAEMKEEKNALMNQDPGNPNWETAQMIREYQNTLEFNPLTDGQAIEDHQITVCVRKRPLSRKELNRKEVDVISVPRKDTLIVHEPRHKVDLTKFLENHKFRFDYAFDDHCDNAIVYKYTAKPLVQTIFEGGMATCFAYGQTGSGKTHTMGGEFNGKIQDCKNGIYAMAAKDVFSCLNSSRYRHLNLVVSASFFEIYSGKVFDLLSDKQKLRVLEDGKQQVQVVGLTEKVVESVEEVLKLIQHGNTARTSGQTSANSNSSRSHAVFQIVLRPPGSMKIHGKFSFIDLAGNERGADTSSANRQTRMEGAEINKSLLALKECIRALGKQSAHLPFRVSKLTQVLRDSFIGEKSKTCMIAMISPGLSSCEHTLNTLRYADRVKELVVKETPETLMAGSNDMDNVIYEEEDEETTTLSSPMSKMRVEDLPTSTYNNHNNNNNNNNNNSLNKNGQMSQSDLALLRSLSEHDMPDELLVQHAAISDLQQSEERVVDQHRAINDYITNFLPESLRLYNMTNYVDYDQDTYCKEGETYFTQLAEMAISCRDLMSDFRAKLAKEEMLSCKAKAATVSSEGRRC